MAKRRTGNSSEVRIGPWPRGIDNVHGATHAVFQVGREELPRLRVATDVDLDDEGWPRARDASVMDTAVTAPLGLWRVLGQTLVQDGEDLSNDDGVLLSGLTTRASLCEHAARVYVTDGSLHREYDGSSMRTWGLPVPVLSLSVSEDSGNFETGRYLVQACFVDAAGNEGGTSAVSAIVLAAGEAIDVALDDEGPDTSDVSAVRIYVSEANQRETSFAAEVAPASMPQAVTGALTTAGLPPVTESMRGPIPGCAGVFSFRAFLLMWRDNAVFRSEALEPHLFHPDDVMQFPADVRACAGLEGGMWIGTDDGLWWVAGEHPEAWIPARRSAVGVLPDCAVVNAAKIPAMQSAGLAALFVTADGELVAGTGSGSVIPLTDGRYRVEADTRVSIAYAERDDLSQILIACQ